MRYLPTSKLTPGMALGQDIYDGAGRLLLAKHLLLSAEYISNLEFLGFPGIYIDDEFTRGIEIQQILNPQVKSQALSVVHDLFAFDMKSGVADVPVSEIKIQKTIERIVENILSNGDIMCNVLDIKNYDDYIYYHSINVAMMSAMVGARYGLSEEQLYQLTTAAILHDIGKRFVDIGIVNGDHSLSEEEQKLLNQHPKLGADCLRSNYHFSALVYASVQHHHENYDGSGSPLEKSGDQIPLYARIIRLIDQYDDMVSVHRQREEISPAEAVEYLMAGSGSLFDPKIVELFVEKIAVYPVGCEVELSNGMHGVVAHNFERFFLRPIVKIIETGEMLNLRDDPNARSIIISKIVIH